MADWDPEAGFGGYERRMRSFVEANQEIGRLHVRSLLASGPDAEPSPQPEEWDLELIDRAINGAELPDYAGVPDFGIPARLGEHESCTGSTSRSAGGVPSPIRRHATSGR